MKTVLFLAIKNITGNKKKSAFIVLIISVVLIMSLIVATVKANILVYDGQMLKIEKGSWHFIVPVLNDGVKKDILALECISDVAIVRRTLVLEDERESYDCFRSEPDGIDLLIGGNIIGELPQEAGEVLVPDWYLEKYSIGELPCSVSICGLKLCITGTYATTSDDVYNEKVRLYFGSAELPELFNSATYETSPVDNIILNGNNTVFAFVRMNAGSNLDDTIKTINQLSGVCSFLEGNNTDGYLKDGVLLNQALLEAEKYISTSNYTSNFISDNLSQIITAIVLIILFVSIYIAMNLIVSGDVKLCGILEALGLSSRRIIYIYLMQALFLCILAIPLGGGMGIAGSYILLKYSLARVYGTFLFPWNEMMVCLFFCVVFVILAALAPAIQASKISCIDAIYGRETSDNRILDGFNSPALINVKSEFSFVLHYSARSIMVNKTKILSLILAISLLLSVFIMIAYQIEALRKRGNGRQSYNADFVIGYNGSLDSTNKFIDKKVVDEFVEIDGVDKVYFQYSIADTMMDQFEGMYNYFFMLNEDTVTDQAYKQMNLSSPVTRVGYDGKLFVQAGISGYGLNELELAKNYLVEGNVAIEDMQNGNVILLPKYILWLENMDIPYTNLQVGDQITIVENKTESLLEMDIVREITFTIGGFVDALPLPQVNGVSNGFVAIMYFGSLEQFQTPYKGIREIYIDGNVSDNTISVLEEICHEHGLTFTNNINNFKQQEQKEKQNLLIYAFYSIFIVLGLVLFLAIFYILLSNIILRTREFSLLHIIGTKKWQRNLSIILEMISFTIPGILLGDCTGILFILAGDLSGEILKLYQIIPYKHILISNGITIAATAFSALLGTVYVSKNISVNLNQI